MNEIDEQIKIYREKVAENERNGRFDTANHMRLKELIQLKRENQQKKRARKFTGINNGELSND